MAERKTYLDHIKRLLKSWDKRLLDYLYPNDENCLFCSRRWPSRRFFLCKKCEAGLIELPHDQKIVDFPLAKPAHMRGLSAFRSAPFEALYAKYSNSLFAKRLLLAYKKYSRAYLSFCLANMLIELIDEMIDMDEIDALCYIPSTPAKINKRGFDNMKLIAEKVAEHYDIELVDVLGMRNTKKEQKGLSQEKRFQNISDAFYLKYDFIKEGGEPIRVLLLDDVITTGATMEAAARCLRSGGLVVYGAAIFRSIHR